MILKKIMVIIVAMLIITMNMITFAAGKEVEVTIPEFGVTIDNEEIDNEHNEYPLIVYKDITYFPMTWNFSRSLGLSSDWNNETGLSIAQSDKTEELLQDKSVVNDLSKTYSAELADFAIDLNGNAIHNSEEEYPILLFRNVTYFPLTWKFTVEEFGWESGWDDSKGLSIVNANLEMTINVDDSDNNTTDIADINNSSIVVNNNNIDSSVNDSNNVFNDYSTNITNNIDNSVNVDYNDKLNTLLEEIQKLTDSNATRGNSLISFVLKDKHTNEAIAGASVYFNDMLVGVSDLRGIVEIEAYKYAQYAIEIKHDEYYSISITDAYNDSEIINQTMINKNSSKIIKLGVDEILLREIESSIIDGRVVDKVDYPFENDENVLGKWQSISYVDHPLDFNGNSDDFKYDLYFGAIEFLSKGRTDTVWSWTDGLVLHGGDNTAARYFIAEVNGEEYLFMEFKNGDYVIRHDDPKYYVMKRITDDDVTDLLDESLRIPSDGTVILNASGDRISIKGGSLVKDLIAIIENIDSVTDVSVLHDDGFEADMNTEIQNVHNLTIVTTTSRFLKMIDVVD